jgi:hypothetical protein
VLVAFAGYWYLFVPRWRTYTSPDATFRVDFPVRPSVQEVPDKEFGVLHVVVAKPSLHAVYSCSWREISSLNSRAPDEFMDRARDFGIQGVEGVLLDERKITIQGYPARDVRIRARGRAVLTDRTILAGSRLYSLTVVNTDGVYDAKNIERFLRSFYLRWPQ